MGDSSHKYKVGRNDLCQCGSGKKYKKCCLLDLAAEEEGEAHELTPSLQEMMIKTKKKYKNEPVTIGTSEELGLERMSDILLEFADELLREAEDHEEEQHILMVATTAWNIAVMAGGDLESTTDHIKACLKVFGFKKDSKAWKAMMVILLALVEKKGSEFPGIDRLILDFEVIKTKKEFQLNVVSTPVPANESQPLPSRGAKR